MMLLFVAVMILTTLTIYWPNYIRLKDSLNDTFAISGYSKRQMLEQYVSNSIDIAVALSTRNYMREALIDYQSGTIDLPEVKRRSEQAFLSGIRPFSQIVYASRRTTDATIVEYGLVPPELTVSAEVSLSPVRRFSRTENHWFLIVDSPVLQNEKILAVDTLVFSLDAIVHEMNRERLDVQLVPTTQLMAQYDDQVSDLADGQVMVSSDDVLFGIWVDEGATSLLVQHQKRILYRPLMTAIVTNLLTLSLIFILIIAFTHLVLKHYRRELVQYMQKIIERQQDEIQAARFDELTQVYNRRSGFDRIQRSIRRAKLRDENLCLIFVDANGLKEINDHLGHEHGDELLQTIAAGIRRHIRHDDYIARFGGDEFVVILHRTTESDTEQVWQRIQAYFDEINQNDGRPYLISVSHGIVEIHNAEDSAVDTYLKQADEAMYREKKEIKQTLPHVLRV